MNNLPAPQKNNFFKKIFFSLKQIFFPEIAKAEIERGTQIEDFFKSNFENIQINSSNEFFHYLEKAQTGEFKSNSILDKCSPELLDNKKIVLEGLAVFGLDLKHIKNEEFKKDEEILSTAIESNPLAIKYIDQNLEIASKLIKQAVTQNYISLYHVNNDFKLKEENRQFLLETVQKHGLALEHLPNYHNDIEFLTKGTNQDPKSIQYAGKDIPNELIISSVKRIQKEILEKSLKIVKECKNAFEFDGYYQNLNTNLYNIVENIKKANPDRFNDSEFIESLSSINPKLAKLANENIRNTPRFKEKIEKSNNESVFEPYARFKKQANELEEK